MLYMKSCELKNLGIDAAEVYEMLARESDLREYSGKWHLGISCYAYSTTLERMFHIEDLEPKYNSPIGSMLLVTGTEYPRIMNGSVERSTTIYDEYDIPF